MFFFLGGGHPVCNDMELKSHKGKDGKIFQALLLITLFRVMQ